MPIEIKHGFLMLNSNEKHGNYIIVKGSAILSITPVDTWSQLGFGRDHWVEVKQSYEEVLEAIGRSYTQARAR